MKPLYLILTATTILLNIRVSFGQGKDGEIADSLIKQFHLYKLKKQHGTLFAHFDKNVYTNNENVWFTAYLLNAESEKNDLLSVIVIKDADESIVLQEKFVMNNGISFGNIFLPDTLRSGNYSFLLYANTTISKKPVDIFIQPITVKSNSQISLKTSLSLLDTEKFPEKGLRRVLLTVKNATGNLIADAYIKFYTGSASHPVLSGEAHTDKNGEYLFKIPADQLLPGRNVLRIQVNHHKDKAETKLILPVYKAKLSVRFYPEGGHLSDRVRSTIGWEVKNFAGVPYHVSGILFCNNKAIDTVSTGEYGIGHFSLVPYNGNHYYVKLLADYKDSVYNLPDIITDLPVINIPKAIANDTLKLSIRSRQRSKVYLVIHNFKECFTVFPVVLNAAEKKMLVPLVDIPKGLTEITMLDSALRPCAERAFFVHYDKQIHVNIITDKSIYGKREKVNVRVRLSRSDNSTKSLSGLVSIGCVQGSRLELKKEINIDSYYYLLHNLGSLPQKKNYLGNEAHDKAFLEDILLIKDWRLYDWKELINANTTDTLVKEDTLNFTGSVTYLGRPLKKPIILIIRNDSTFSTIETDNKGQFTLPDRKLMLRAGKKVYIAVNGKQTENYDLVTHDPYDRINANLSRIFNPIDYENIMSEDNERLKGLDHSIQLKEVKITANKNNNLSFNGTNANPCGDYVCRYHVLNCANHRNDLGNHPARAGETYIVYDYIEGIFTNIKYTGCNIPQPSDKILKIAGIYYPIDFYPADYTELSPSQPEYLSTIYWKYLSNVSSNTDLTFSFFTSDIPGDFKIIVQGVSENDVLYGEKTISVNN